MKNTVLMSILTVAGLAASAQADNAECILVLDNDPRLAAMGVNLGTRALLPGPSATAVGVIMLARMTTTVATAPNLGIVGVGPGGSTSTPNSVFRHNDAVSNVTTALWTSPGLAFQRGFVGVSAVTGTERGLMDYTSPTTGLHNWRGLIPNASPSTGASANGSNPAPSDNPYNSQTSGPGAHTNGYVGVGGAGTPAGGLILAITGARNGLAALPGGINPYTTVSNFALHQEFDENGDPLPQLTNGDTDPNTTGQQSEWVAMYRAVFIPRSNTGGPIDITRDVTVSFEGTFRYGISSGSTPGGFTTTASGTVYRAGGSITFQVPTPGAMALLGLGGLVAGRRRRA